MTREAASYEPGDSIVRVAEVMKREAVEAVRVVESKSSRRLVGIITDRRSHFGGRYEQDTAREQAQPWRTTRACCIACP